MRIDINDEEVVKYIKWVTLDGKRVAMATLLDTEEGWIEVRVPHVQHAAKVEAGKIVDISDESAGQYQFDWETKRLYGKVEVIWHDDTPTCYRLSGAVQE